MTQKRPDLVADADLEARRLALSLMQAKHAALAWTDPQSLTPGISRIAYGLDESGIPTALISGLAPHTQALRANPACALMLGEPGDKRAHAEFVAADDPARATLRAHWLKGHPKTTLYVDLPDFAFVRLVPQSALLNAGFGKAFSLTPQDLR
ncbi:pyridoxamine 5-phosphate oxidase [Cypionkella sp.]|uniref:pyridoxamine 5-phosphate oxidase n=1 Tax=Cypionkella sp. TaxID=2811411 RepID=UPI0026298120|nr:pyridoxamine 5-phosphate oxidase [Cypionkella sp.]MDB5665952.1 pyridoxamine 5-phosphate oxidase [Cypionkella sp.]